MTSCCFERLIIRAFYREILARSDGCPMIWRVKSIGWEYLRDHKKMTMVREVGSRARLAAALFVLATSGTVAAEGDVRFDITRFQVEGNTLLTAERVDALVTPFAGKGRVYGDIQQALEALEAAYRQAGFGSVQVFVPEQELTTGVVRIQVAEAVIGKVAVSGNLRFDDANVRASLPALQEGKAPNLRQLSENVQLSNENPAKQVEVVLAVGEAEGTVDAKVAVEEEDPQRVFLLVDNTGTGATGKHRVGVAYQHANLLGRDQVFTLAYQGSPDAPQGVKAEVFAVAYRQPLYGLGDSIDFIYGKSAVNTPSSTLALGSPLAINGKGDVLALRWNHYFPRRGEYSGRLIFGLDYKYIDSRCSFNGDPMRFDPPGGGTAGCTPHTVRPLSITYAGGWQSAADTGDYSIGLSRNWALGSRYTAPGSADPDRYSMLASTRQTRDDFSILKFSGSWLRALPAEWRLRVAANGQFSRNPLVAAEQFGVAGSTAVRGFGERVVSTDSGWVGNLELYTPDLAAWAGLPGALRALAFYDFGRGRSWNVARSNNLGAYEKAAIASVGVGLRYGLKKDVSLRMDLAQVVDAGPADVAPSPAALNPINTEGRGDWRGHFSLSVGF